MMSEALKTAWLLGQFTPDIASELEQKGYQVRTFDSGGNSPVHFFDERPDMVLVADVNPRNFEIITRLHQLFPQALVMSVPQTTSPKTLAVNDARVQSAEERLISSLNLNKESL